MARGRLQFEKWQSGKPISRAEAMKAHCYECNGEDEGDCDCQGYSCPMYQYFAYKPTKNTPDTVKAIRDKK